MKLIFNLFSMDGGADDITLSSSVSVSSLVVGEIVGELGNSSYIYV